MPGRGRPFRPGQSGNPGGARAFLHKTWPLAREILHRAIRTNQPAFEQTLSEVMLTRKGALQVLELLAKLNREIGSRADEAPAVRPHASSSRVSGVDWCAVAAPVHHR
jgi:hypothetical protein